MMLTSQSKKYKNKPALLYVMPSAMITQPETFRKSVIYTSQHWRYFFTRKKVPKLWGGGWRWKYTVKKGKKDIVKRAQFLHKKGYYKHQKVTK